MTTRRGKGGKDRVVPIGLRALQWTSHYLREVHPQLASRTGATTLFISNHGRPLCRNNLSAIVRGYLNRVGIQQRGSCHLLRHTAATLMMQHGADLRSLQLLLGHERLDTTQIYTHVTITRLKQVHDQTHPAQQPPNLPKGSESS
ncbi:MAG: tyrosine-type recombinase/integrase [Pirellulaceae bacterium]